MEYKYKVSPRNTKWTICIERAEEWNCKFKLNKYVFDLKQLYYSDYLILKSRIRETKHLSTDADSSIFLSLRAAIAAADSVVQWCQRDLEFFPSNPSKKISHKRLRKQGLLF